MRAVLTEHFVRAYIAAHPEVREHLEAGEPAAGPGSDREAAVRIGQQAKEAFESGDHQRALTLLDEAELRYPNPAIHWSYPVPRHPPETR